MVKLNRIYTKTGDSGKTGLGDGSRIAKTDIRVAVMGDVDEVNALIGIAMCTATGRLAAELAAIQNDLFDLGADISVPEKIREKGQKTGEVVQSRLRVSESQVKRLEKQIDGLTAKLTPLTSFILPGGSQTSSWLHLARTVARRAERALFALAAKQPVNAQALHYLNRLSDYLFVAARWANAKGKKDVLWQPGAGRAK